MRIPAPPTGTRPAMGFRQPKMISNATDEAPARDNSDINNARSIISTGSLSLPCFANRRFVGSSGERSVVYPSSSSCDKRCVDDIFLLTKRADVDYHQLEPVLSNKSDATSSVSSSSSSVPLMLHYVEEDNLIVRTHHDSSITSDPLRGATAAAGVALGTASISINSNRVDVLPYSTTSDVSKDAAIIGSTEEQTENDDVITRLPHSPLGKLYFQVETDGATKHEKIGIIIIDCEQRGVQMYDRVGRQHGNRDDPGYPIKAEEIENAKAGVSMKIGSKTVLLITALQEDAFRSGEFFLRSEHQQRKKEEKCKAQADAVAASTAGSIKPRMSFGSGFGMTFGALCFHKRPKEGSTGFIVPVLGRHKTPGAVQEYKALYDPDREGAVVLFRADYKRDSNGQPIVSVVVDPIIGDKLRPHQCIGVKFLYDCITGERMPGYYGAILADEMGLGKTIQTVATIYTCLKQGKYGRPVSRKCLVVAPSSLVSNWCKEFDKWLGEGSVKYFAISESTPKGDRILSRFDGEGDVLVISYDQLRKYIERLSKMTSVDLVVCDEGHRLKNAEIKTTKAVDLLPTRRRIILSGTPIQNDLTEFHAMVGFVNPGILGTRDLFGRVFEEPVMRGRDPQCPEPLKELGADRAHYLANLTQKFILRRAQTINEKYLPAKVDCTVFCRLGEEQSRSYQRIADLSATLSSTPLVLITALKKLCNHMDLLYNAIQVSATNGIKNGEVASIPLSVLPKSFKLGCLDASYGSKLAFVSFMLDELIANGERDKLVIVSNYTQTLNIIASLCQKKKVSFFQLDGNTPIKRRQELVDRFNVPMAQEIVFLLSSKAGGVGLNLIGANRLILFDPDWNPANDAQAMGRVWRDGQKKKVFIYRLLSTGTIEEKVYQRQVSKQGLSANVVDMKDDSKQHFTMEELRSLFTFRPETKCDTHDLLGCKCLESVETTMITNGFRKVGAPLDQMGRTGPRMDELKSWKHVNAIDTFTLDKVMQRIATRDHDLVSFLFANERDAAKLEIEIEQEKAFVQDEGMVTCCSQVIDNDSDIEFDVVDNDDDYDEDNIEDGEKRKMNGNKSRNNSLSGKQSAVADGALHNTKSSLYSTNKSAASTTSAFTTKSVRADNTIMTSANQPSCSVTTRAKIKKDVFEKKVNKTKKRKRVDEDDNKNMIIHSSYSSEGENHHSSSEDGGSFQSESSDDDNCTNNQYLTVREKVPKRRKEKIKQNEMKQRRKLRDTTNICNVQPIKESIVIVTPPLVDDEDDDILIIS